jgi:hypothetical protein
MLSSVSDDFQEEPGNGARREIGGTKDNNEEKQESVAIFAWR